MCDFVALQKTSDQSRVNLAFPDSSLDELHQLCDHKRDSASSENGQMDVK